MGFTRDDIAAYEKQPQKMDAPNTLARAFAGAQPIPPMPPHQTTATPAATPPAPAAPEPVTPAADSVPAAPVDVSSAEPAAPATAPAEPDSGSTDPNANVPAEPAARTIPYDRFQEVIDERNALKKYGELLFERLEAQKQAPAIATPAAPAAAPPVAPAAIGPPPTLASVGFDEAVYNQKLNEWHEARARVIVRAELESQQAQQRAQQVDTTYRERETEFAKANPTFKEVTKAPLPNFAVDTARTILESPEGPAIVFRLAKNPDEAVRLSRMSPAQQLVRLGEIRSELKAPAPAPAARPPAQTPRTVTQAPPPPRPTPGGSAPAPTGMPPAMNDFVAQERAKTIADRQQRLQMRKAMR